MDCYRAIGTLLSYFDSRSQSFDIAGNEACLVFDLLTNPTIMIAP